MLRMNPNAGQCHSPRRHFHPAFLEAQRAAIDTRAAPALYGLYPGLSVPFSVAILSSVG
jgi:hypothetical protein